VNYNRKKDYKIGAVFASQLTSIYFSLINWIAPTEAMIMAIQRDGIKRFHVVSSKITWPKDIWPTTRLSNTLFGRLFDETATTRTSGLKLIG
jgi:hypothetical protein